MKKKIVKIIVLFLLTLGLLLTQFACNINENLSAKTDTSLTKVLEAGQLVLGLDMAFPPMGYIDTDGETKGFDIDVAKEVCNRLGVELVLRGINWNAKEQTLNSGSIDCIWNGLSITPSRAEEMCLSDPYMKNELIVVVPGNSDIRSMSELNGVTIGVQAGSTSEEVLETSDTYSDAVLKKFDTADELLKALKNGEMDAALVDSVVAYYFIFSSSDVYYILPDSLGEEEYAIAFRKGDQALCNKIQDIISDMKTDGTLGEISKKWFGSDITIVK